MINQTPNNNNKISSPEVIFPQSLKFIQMKSGFFILLCGFFLIKEIFGLWFDQWVTGGGVKIWGLNITKYDI